METFKNWVEAKEKSGEGICWKGYERVPGTKKYDKGSCRPKKGFKEFVEDKDADLLIEKKDKPYKGYDPDKNHPEGGLKPSVARKMGIHAGIETKREVEKKGGVDKLSDKTAARRKSFCARMQGMKEKNTSKKTANDPDSKINAALRVWKC